MFGMSEVRERKQWPAFHKILDNTITDEVRAHPWYVPIEATDGTTSASLKGKGVEREGSGASGSGGDREERGESQVRSKGGEESGDGETRGRSQVRKTTPRTTKQTSKSRTRPVKSAEFVESEDEASPPTPASKSNPAPPPPPPPGPSNTPSDALSTPCSTCAKKGRACIPRPSGACIPCNKGKQRCEFAERRKRARSESRPPPKRAGRSKTPRPGPSTAGAVLAPLPDNSPAPAKKARGRSRSVPRKFLDGPDPDSAVASSSIVVQRP